MSHEEPQGPIAALKLPRNNLVLISLAKKISNAMNGNPHFPNPVITPAALNVLIAALEQSQGKVGGGKAQTKQRNVDRLALVQGLRQERDFVQVTADQQGNATAAAAVITSAGMLVRKVTKANKAPLAAKHGAVSGSVLLVALAVLHAKAYYWAWSLDQKSWTSAADTTKAKTTIAGLVPGTLVHFRCRALATKTGTTDWSQIVSLIVM